MRKQVYLPEYMKDRLRNYRANHEQIDENIALIRLISMGLDVAEKQELQEKQQEDPHRSEGHQTPVMWSLMFPYLKWI